MLHATDIDTLRAVALFAGLEREDLAQILPHLARVVYPAGTNLISVTQPGELVYIILEGSVKIHCEQPDGRDVIMAILGAGDVVGEMSLVDSAARSANVVTQERTTLVWMQRGAFQRCLEAYPTIIYNLVLTLSGRLRLANEHVQALATLDVSGRIARQILIFAQRYGVDSGGGATQIPLRLTQSDLAGLVGASRERVNQVLGAFKSAGYISVNRRYHMTVHNPAALMELSWAL